MDPVTQSGPSKAMLPASVCSNLTPLAGLAAWITNPLPRVGTTTAPLSSVPTGSDYASRTGCRSQSFTSWDSSSRSFVLRIVHADAGQVDQEQGNLNANQALNRLMEPDVPGVVDKSMWTRTDNRMYLSGAKIFYRGVGLVTPRQRNQPSYQARILGLFAHNTRAANSAQQTTPTITFRPYLTTFSARYASRHIG